MRFLLLTVLSIATAFAADMCYAHVSCPSGEDVSGWWDRGAKVLYLLDGTCRLMDQPDAKVTRATCPEGVRAPARRQFVFLTTLPYGRATFGDRVFVGWVHAPSGTVFTEAFPGGIHGDPTAFKSLEEMPAPGPVPAEAWPWLNHWTVEHSPAPEAELAKP